MRYSWEISRDGPNIRVLLPDVLPPDWEALRRALESELEEGANRVQLVLGECPGFSPEDPAFVWLEWWLRRAGVDVVTIPDEGDARPSATTYSSS